MSLPRVLELGPRGALEIEAARELHSVGDPICSYAEYELVPGNELRPDKARGDCLEICVEIDPGSATASMHSPATKISRRPWASGAMTVASRISVSMDENLQ